MWKGALVLTETVFGWHFISSLKLKGFIFESVQVQPVANDSHMLLGDGVGEGAENMALGTVLIEEN